VALVGSDGRLLALVRGGTSSPHALGFNGCVSVLSELVADAAVGAGLTGECQPVADVARVLLAGDHLDEEVNALQTALGALGWAPSLVVENDTLALLRTARTAGGVSRSSAAAASNAVGIAADGRAVRFPALGAITG